MQQNRGTKIVKTTPPKTKMAFQNIIKPSFDKRFKTNGGNFFCLNLLVNRRKETLTNLEFG